MYWVWYFLFLAQPEFLFLGLIGVLGDEAEKAADDVLPIFGTVGLVLLILGIVFGVAYIFTQ